MKNIGIEVWEHIEDHTRYKIEIHVYANIHVGSDYV